MSEGLREKLSDAVSQYVDMHEIDTAADAAIKALQDPSPEQVEAGVRALVNARHTKETIEAADNEQVVRAIYKAMMGE